MTKNLVETKNINKYFVIANRQNQVLSNIDLKIPSGKLTMLVGPSGCGKTTLISIITGILRPSSGEVIINGVNITSLKDKQKTDFRRQNLGFIFQQYNLLPALTAAENVAIPLIANQTKFSLALQKAKKILSEIDMSQHLDKLPNQLSGGQQQRVAIARALVCNPKLIVCDEPTAALDGKTGYLVMEILKNICKSEERAVIVVSHDNRIFNFADKIVEMEDGRILSDN